MSDELNSSSAASARAKLARALEHLVELDRAVGAYLESEPLDVVRQLQPDGKTSVFALRVKLEPPLDLSVRAGDVIHQTRSALDHLANGLVMTAGNEPTKHTSFPVLLKQPPTFRVFGGVVPEALAVVEELQPYQSASPETHPLAVLDRLWNIDKHRSLHLAVTKIGGTQIFLQSESFGTLLGGQFQPGPLGDDDIIGVFEFSGEPPVDTDVIASGSIFVAFSEEGPWGTDRAMLEILERLHQYVTNVVVPRVEPLLAKAGA